MTAAILRRIDMCNCVMTAAAAAQDTAEGVVLVAAGGAAGDPSEAANAVRIFTGELRFGRKQRYYDELICAAAW